eukprot:Tbor_TRINITY_DN4242_c0_g1::TRINITY_DN4242_c0_g1_i1::g.23929::m.23929
MITSPHAPALLLGAVIVFLLSHNVMLSVPVLATLSEPLLSVRVRGTYHNSKPQFYIIADAHYAVDESGMVCDPIDIVYISIKDTFVGRDKSSFLRPGYCPSASDPAAVPGSPSGQEKGYSTPKRQCFAQYHQCIAGCIFRMRTDYFQWTKMDQKRLATDHSAHTSNTSKPTAHPSYKILSLCASTCRFGAGDTFRQNRFITHEHNCFG